MSAGRMWMVLPLAVGVGVGALWWAMAPGPAPLATPAAGKVEAGRPTGGPGWSPGARQPAAAGDPAAAGAVAAGGRPPITDPATLRAMAHDMQDQLGGGTPLPGNPMGGNGEPVPIEDPRARFDREAGNAVRRAEMAVADARQRYKWDDATMDGVNRSLDEYDRRVSDIQKRYAAGGMVGSQAAVEMQAVARSTSEEISKQVGPDAGAEISKALSGAEQPAQEDIDWWEGIPFEEWAAQMEAEQQGKR